MNERAKYPRGYFEVRYDELKRKSRRKKIDQQRGNG